MLNLRKDKEFMKRLRATLLYYEADLDCDDDSIHVHRVTKFKSSSSDDTAMTIKYAAKGELYEITMRIDVSKSHLSRMTWEEWKTDNSRKVEPLEESVKNYNEYLMKG